MIVVNFWENAFKQFDGVKAEELGRWKGIELGLIRNKHNKIDKVADFHPSEYLFIFIFHFINENCTKFDKENYWKNIHPIIPFLSNWLKMNAFHRLLIILFIFYSNLFHGFGYKILVFSPTISASHVISNARIADVLAKDGHQVVNIYIKQCLNIYNLKMFHSKKNYL